MEAKLVVVAGKVSKPIVQLRLPAVLGRSRDADVTIAHPMVSRRHCEFFEQNGVLMLRDLASLNGTLIGGRRVALAPLLPQGEFAIGPIVFRVLYEFQGELAAVPETQFTDGVRGCLAPPTCHAPTELAKTDYQMPHVGAQAPHNEFVEWAEEQRSDVLPVTNVENLATPAPTAPASPTAQPLAAQPGFNVPQSDPQALPANVRALRDLSVPRDKLPTILLPEVERESPWDDGVSRWTPGPFDPSAAPQLPGANENAASQKPADAEFGRFLEGLE